MEPPTGAQLGRNQPVLPKAREDRGNRRPRLAVDDRAARWVSDSGLPRATFIATIKGWHVGAVFALTLFFIVVTQLTGRATPSMTRLQDGLFASIAIPVMAFTLAFLMYALPNRQFSASQLFPSVLIAISAFVAVGITGAILDDPGFPPSIAIPMGLALSIIFSGLIVGMRFLFPKFF